MHQVLLVSGTNVVILDPSNRSFPPGTAPKTTLSRCKSGHLRTLHGLCGFDAEAKPRVAGTMLRVPLRTEAMATYNAAHKKTSLSALSCSASMIRESFTSLMDSGPASLLFLRHVRRITFRIIPASAIAA